MRHRILLPLVLVAIGFSSCQGEPETGEPTTNQASLKPDTAPAADPQQPMNSTPDPISSPLETATFGAGCYWCVEAVFEQLDGVHSVASGFMGGESDDATYRQVCSGTTGHAEVVQINFDPKVLPYEELLDWFWRLHDPTTLNRQGADVGTQYRSVIFYHSPEQERSARLSKSTLGERATFTDPVVTEISPASKMIPAPDDHQDYYQANSAGSYCQMVIAPKLRKLGLKD